MRVPKKPESATIRAARVELRKRLVAVGRERDTLRDLAASFKTLSIDCDEACDQIQAAIEALSKYA